MLGNLSLGTGGMLDLDAFSGPLSSGNYELIGFTGSVSGNAAGWTVVGNNDPSRQYSFSIVGGNQFDLTVTAVPEPSSVLLAAPGGIGLSIAARRRMNGRNRS